MISLRAWALSVTLLGLQTSALRAYDFNWNTYQGPWSDPESWEGKSVPTASAATYLGTGVAEIDSGTVSAWSVNIGVTLIGNGIAGNGRLEISDNGGLETNAISIASYNGGHENDEHLQVGRLLVTGQDASANTEYLGVGLYGQGTLIVENGAFLHAQNFHSGGMKVQTIDQVSTPFRGNADINVSGPNAHVFISNFAALGTTGDATLNVSAGGRFQARQLRVGESVYNAGGIIERGRGEINLTGGGSLLEVSGHDSRFYIGMNGDAIINVTDGARIETVAALSTSSPVIAYNYGSRGDVVISGNGSQWINDGQIYFGDGGEAYVTIEKGGLLRTTGGFINADGSTNIARGTLIVRGAEEGEPENHGIMETAFLGGSNWQDVRFDQAILRALRDESNFIRGFAARQIFEGGLILDTEEHKVGISSILTGLGGLRKTGSGTLTFNIAQQYNGGTIVEEGTLLFGVNHGAGPSPITLKAGTTFGKSVTGIIDASQNEITIEGDATLVSPGGTFFLGKVNITAEESSTLTVAPTIASQTTAANFVIGGPLSTVGELTLAAAPSDLPLTLAFSGANAFGGKLIVAENMSLHLDSLNHESVNHDLQINTGGTVLLRRSEQISNNHTTRVNGLLQFGTQNTLVETLGHLEGYGTIRSFAASFGPWQQTLNIKEGIFAGTFEDGSQLNLLQVNKISPGTLVLLGDSDHFRGPVHHQQGILLAGHQNALGQGILTLNHGVTLGKSVITDLHMANSSTRILGDATFSAPGGELRLNDVEFNAPSGTTQTLRLESANPSQSESITLAIEGQIGGASDLTLANSAPANSRYLIAGTGPANTYNGHVTLENGVLLELARSSTALAGNITVEYGATLRVTNNEQFGNQSRLSIDGRMEYGNQRINSQTLSYLSLGLDGVIQSYNAHGQNGEWDQRLILREGISYGTIADGSDNNSLSLEKIGEEHLFLAGYGNLYSGDTHIREGSVTISTISGSPTGSGDVYLYEGAVLNGSARIDGSLYVQGELHPGNSPGLMEIGRDLVLGETSLLTMEIWHGNTPGITYDQLIVQGDLTYGGTLRLYFENGYVFNDPLQLFEMNGRVLGSFSQIEILGLDSSTHFTFDYATGRLAIPEPRAVGLLALAALPFLLRHASRKRKLLHS